MAAGAKSEPAIGGEMKSFLAPFENGISYEEGLKLLENLKSFGCDWQLKDSATQRDHNLNFCDFICDEYYEDKNEVFGETVAWVSYWNDVEGDQPIEVNPEKAHWELLDG